VVRAGLRKSTPVEIVDKLNQQINATVTEPKMRTRLTELAATALTASPVREEIHDQPGH
jgi:hypothetical protein